MRFFVQSGSKTPSSDFSDLCVAARGAARRELCGPKPRGRGRPGCAERLLRDVRLRPGRGAAAAPARRLGFLRRARKLKCRSMIHL